MFFVMFCVCYGWILLLGGIEVNCKSIKFGMMKLFHIHWPVDELNHCFIKSLTLKALA